jgi:hypothetical protein
MGDFITALSSALSGRGMKIEDFCKTSDAVEKRMLQEYGAVFLADKKVQIPSRCILDDAGVTAFQSKLKVKTATVGGTSIKLQEAAMDDLLKAETEVTKAKLTLTPRGGSTAASRTFSDTKTFWDNKVTAGIAHWKGKTKNGVKFDEAAKDLLKLSMKDQIKKVLELEDKGFFFSKNFDKTILQSVAAPGASQHLWLLALDIEEFGNKSVRAILAKCGWFQTIKSDLPHFTYLGFEESKLGSLGLKKVKSGSQEFWVPDL